jgi:Holliday junction resolvase
MQEILEVKVKKKKRINSNEKGKRGEREWKLFLWEEGFAGAYRAQQYSGTEGTADVINPSMPMIHNEVKTGKQVPQKIYNFMEQAKRDCGDKIPIVAIKRDYCNWMVVMCAEDWSSIIKETEHVVTIFCPECKKSNVKKKGLTEKLKQRYLCLNTECGTSFILE